MKTDDDFKPFDTVFDSMGACSGATGIPLQILKEMKRSGCDAFKGSRVHLGKLREALAAAKKEPELGTADVLLMIVEQVARIVGEKLLVYRDAKFRADSRKLTQAIHTGFGAALCIVEPDSVDQFLKQSAALMENIFKSARKPAASRSTRKRMAAKKRLSASALARASSRPAKINSECID